MDKLRACLKAEGPRECAGKHLYDSHGLAQGLYSVFLPEWLDYFNQEEMLVSFVVMGAHTLHVLCFSRTVIPILLVPVFPDDCSIRALQLFTGNI